jgi:hypothetical protein
MLSLVHIFLAIGLATENTENTEKKEFFRCRTPERLRQHGTRVRTDGFSASDS